MEQLVKRDDWFPDYQDIPSLGISGSQALAERIAHYDLDEFDGASVLDVGCNIGQMCFQSVDWGARRVLGVEYDKSAYAKALEINDKLKAGVNFFLDDIESPFFWNSIRPVDICLFLSVIDTKELERRYAVLSKAAAKTRRVMYYGGHGVQANPIGKYIKDLIYYTDFSEIVYRGQSIGRPIIRASRDVLNVDDFIESVRNSKRTRIAVVGKSLAGKTYLRNLLAKADVTRLSIIDDLYLNGRLMGGSIEAAKKKIATMNNFILFDYRALEYVKADAVYYITRAEEKASAQRNGGPDLYLRSPGGSFDNVLEYYTVINP